MNKTFFSILFAVVLTACSSKTQPAPDTEEIKFHEKFVENFDKPTSEFFNFNIRKTGDDFRYFSGISSLSEKETDIMLYKIDPEDPAGAGRGPEIISKEFTHFGTYAARIRVPDITKVQPDLGVVVGYFTYHVDQVDGLSEIDFEWLLADPEIIYIGTEHGQEKVLLSTG